MADFRAVTAVSEGIVALLRSNYRVEDFGQELEFKVYMARDFVQPMSAGVSLFVYRIYPEGLHRTPAGRVAKDGRRYKNQLPVNLHFLLTAWAKDASLQHAIAGWMLRMLEDTPVLPAALLNAAMPDVFRPDETVDVALTELDTEDLFHLWEALVPHVYQLSVPYVARNVRIESTRLLDRGEPVQERIFEYANP